MERTRGEIAELLLELADRVAFAGEKEFKARAYREAARRVQEGTVDLSQPGSISQAPGIGPATAHKILELMHGGEPEALTSLRGEQPEDLCAILDLPGIGPSAARRLFASGIGRMAEIERRAAAGEELPGLSASQRAHVLRALIERRRGIPLPVLLRATEALSSAFAGLEPAGALRRLDPVVAEPLWLAPGTARNRRMVDEALPRTLPGAFSLPRDCVRLVDEAVLGPCLLLGTGPGDFAEEVSVALRERGYGISEAGVHRVRDGAAVACPREEDVFALAGMDPVPPPLREIQRDLRAGAVREVWGDLHTHSSWSDGQADIETMVREALALGRRYLAVTDHSQGLKVANGLSPERLRAQRREITDLRRRLPQGFTLLQGCEVDIHPDGSLDLPDEALRELDIVIASVHGHFDQPTDVTTARLVRALMHPLVTVLGHPGARKLGRRPPIEANWDRVLQVAVESGTALEMSASPRRLDLDFQLVRSSRHKDLAWFVVDTDAHSVDELSLMPLGIAQAQKAGVPAEHLLNAGPVERVLDFKRTRGGA